MKNNKNNFGIFATVISFLTRNNIPFTEYCGWLDNGKTLYIHIDLPWVINGDNMLIGFCSSDPIKWYSEICNEDEYRGSEVVEHKEYQTATEIIEKIKEEYRFVIHDLLPKNSKSEGGETK